MVALPDNVLMIDGTRYVEIERNLFREVDGYGRVAFQEDQNGLITGFVVDGFGVMQLYKAPFYETPGFTAGLLAFSAAIFVGVFLRLAYQWPLFRTLQGAEQNVFLASIFAAAANLLFLIFAAVGISQGLIALMYELPMTLKFALLFPMLATVAALSHSYFAIQVWRQRWLGSVWARIRYSLITLCTLIMVWFYAYWNLLGFTYFS